MLKFINEHIALWYLWLKSYKFSQVSPLGIFHQHVLKSLFVCPLVNVFKINKYKIIKCRQTVWATLVLALHSVLGVVDIVEVIIKLLLMSIYELLLRTCDLLVISSQLIRVCIGASQSQNDRSTQLYLHDNALDFDWLWQHDPIKLLKLV